MPANTSKHLILSRPGGGQLNIAPDEWPALVQAVTEALQLDNDPAASLEDLPVGKSSVDSPLGNHRKLVAEFSRINLETPLTDHYRNTIGDE